MMPFDLTRSVASAGPFSLRVSWKIARAGMPELMEQKEKRKSRRSKKKAKSHRLVARRKGTRKLLAQ
jgi:hypothetical protein